MPVATVVKVIELVAESDKDWFDAVRNAVREAAKTVDHIRGVEVYNLTANVRDGDVVEWKANVKIAFVVDGARRDAKARDQRARQGAPVPALPGAP